MNRKKVARATIKGSFKAETMKEGEERATAELCRMLDLPTVPDGWELSLSYELTFPSQGTRLYTVEYEWTFDGYEAKLVESARRALDAQSNPVVK